MLPMTQILILKGFSLRGKRLRRRCMGAREISSSITVVADPTVLGGLAVISKRRSFDLFVSLVCLRASASDWPAWEGGGRRMWRCINVWLYSEICSSNHHLAKREDSRSRTFFFFFGFYKMFLLSNLNN